MAIGAPSSIGSVTSAAANTSTIVITTTAAIVVGNLVVVAIQVPSNTLITVSSVSDGTNSYSLAVAKNDSANYDLEIWYKANAAAVSSGASLTATLSGATTGSNGYGAEAVQVAGIYPVTPLDQIASQNSTTASPTVTTSALAAPNEIAIGASFQNGGTRTYTEDAGFTNLFNLAPGNTLRAGVGYKLVTSAPTYAPTFSGSNGNQTVVATFKSSDLVASAGSFTATGVAALFKVSQLSAAGSFALTGNAALFATSMASAAGSYAVTGNVAFLNTRLLSAAASYALTGNAATFAVNFSCAAGSYIVTGNADSFATSSRRPLYLRGNSYWIGRP